MCVFYIVYLISNPIDILTNILIHGMYLFMCMNIKLAIQEQRNTSLAMPCRRVNLGLRERILNALYIFEFCTL